MSNKFEDYLINNQCILMEGALGERLKREYHLTFDKDGAMASLIYSERGRSALKSIWNEYISIARKYKMPFIATTPTRRANLQRVKDAGMSDKIITDNVNFLKSIASDSYQKMCVGGLMGCKGDAYTGEGALNREEARDFHSWQVEKFKKAGVDFLYAGIMPTLPEAIGMAEAMSDSSIPYIISFTIKNDGKLIDGTTINNAIQIIDTTTRQLPTCYMTNCIHPSIVNKALQHDFNRTPIVKERFLGIQANTSPLSYEELDQSIDLKTSDPDIWATEMIKLKKDYGMKIFGGCCGTDQRYMEIIASMLSN